MKKLCSKIGIISFACIVLNSTANAECVVRYNFFWGQNDTGVIHNLTSGEPCRVPLYIRGGTSLEKLEIIEKPKGINTKQESTSIFVTADKTFNGRGKMIVRFHGKGVSDKVDRKAEVVFDISSKN